LPSFYLMYQKRRRIDKGIQQEEGEEVKVEVEVKEEGIRFY